MSGIERYGYYLFLGLGDYHRPERLRPNWTSTWGLEEWQWRLDRLKRLGANTLFVFMMGKELPYPSKAYPDCVERRHPNVRKEFFQKVLDGAAERGIETVAVFATTGHAGAFLKGRPYLEISPRPQGSKAGSSVLRAFPEEEAKIAVARRAGGAQVGSGIMCHLQQEVRDYPVNIVTECLTRYKGFSGVVLHPPEFVSACFCGDCRADYQKRIEKDLLKASDEEARGAFMDTNLAFQKSVLEPLVKRLLPKGKAFTFTIPWVFEKHFEEFAERIPKSTVIVDWDYDLAEERIAQLQGRLKKYGKFGHKVWFMPSSGFAFSPKRGREKQEAAVRRQIRLATEVGVKDIVYFMGPVWTRYVEGTSYHLHS